MKGIVLAGGRGTRLAPLTRTMNKHLLPVYDRPMVCYPIETLVRAGIREVLVVTGPEHVDAFRAVLGNGRQLGVARLDFAQQPDARGIADALRYGEQFAEGEPVAVILGDNLFGERIALTPPDAGALIFLKRVRDPRQYGVAEFRGRHLSAINEKPRHTTSQYAVAGLYLYDSQVFDIIRALKPSPRREFEISDVNNAYLALGQLRHRILRGWWCDAGASPQALLAAGLQVARERGHRV